MPMNRAFILAALLALTGCAQDAAPPATSSAAPALSRQEASPPPAQPAAAIAAAPRTPAPTPAVISKPPNIPTGAMWTIYCRTIANPTHVPDSELLKQQLIRRTGSSDWFVVHGEDASTLYYGYFKTFEDAAQPEEKLRAQQARQMVSQLRADNGDTPFANCTFALLNSADPPAPPEWNLKNAKGFWSVQVGVYRGSPSQKEAALEAVKQARAAGIEAYYNFGASSSIVCIGAWPMEAVKPQDASVASSDDPNKMVVVLPAPLPPEYKTHDLMVNGKPAKVMVPRVEIQDPTMIAVLKQYPENALNGEVHMKRVETDKGIQIFPEPSFLVQIPRPDQNP